MNAEQLIAELKQCEQSDEGYFLITEDLIWGLVSFLDSLPKATAEEDLE